jgi:hypothetical protein
MNPVHFHDAARANLEAKPDNLEAKPDPVAPDKRSDAAPLLNRVR